MKDLNFDIGLSNCVVFLLMWIGSWKLQQWKIDIYVSGEVCFADLCFHVITSYLPFSLKNGSKSHNYLISNIK